MNPRPFPLRDPSRRPTGNPRRPPFIARTALILASLVGTAACFGGPDGGGTGIDEPENWMVSLTVTNVGDGTGGVVAEFSAGTVDNACPDFLEPEERCTIEAEHTRVISGVAVDTEPGPSSRFAGFDGDCSGTDAECEIQVPQEAMVSLNVEVDFRLVDADASTGVGASPM